MKKIISFSSAIFILVLISTQCFSQSIKKVKIGRQIWMAENLNVDHFSNGDSILEAKTNEEWKQAGEKHQPAWCYYDNDTANGKKYGKLYNWYAVNDPRGLAPKGWHVPTDHEWTKLTNHLDGSGYKMKSTSGWYAGQNGNNSSGFSGLPGGRRYDFGTFYNIGENGTRWSSTEDQTTNARSCDICWWLPYMSSNNSSKRIGFSVRCIKD